MKNIIHFLFFLSVTAFLGCTDQKPTKTSSTGRTAEIMIVCDSKYWESSVGDTIKKYFSRPQVGLPQSEPTFMVIHFKPEAFKKFIRKHRNILILEFNNTRKEPKIEMKRNVWAKPQIVVKLTLKNENQFFNVFDEKKEIFEKYYREAERLRIIRAFKSIDDVSVKATVKKKFGFSMVIPKGFYVASSDDQTMWLRKELQESSQGLLIHMQEYTDTNIFSTNNIVAMRDSLLKKFVPGPEEGTYMITEKILPPESNTVSIDESFTVETRGLWKVEGMFYGGGPFTNYVIVDEARNLLFMIDGYVFAPNDEKRDFLLQVESIIYSLKFIKKKS